MDNEDIITKSKSPDTKLIPVDELGSKTNDQ